MTIIRPESTAISLGYKLRFLILAELDAQQMTRAALADRVGMSQKHLSQLLNARVGMSVDQADNLLAALDREWTVGTAPRWGEPTLENWRMPVQGSTTTSPSSSAVDRG